MAVSTSLKAVIYCRISDARNGDTNGVSDQAKRCRELAGRLGWQVARVITENDTSAFKRRMMDLPGGGRGLRVDRKGWRSMLDDLGSGAADGLIAYDLDRACRDPRDLEDLIDVVEASRPRIPVESVTGSLRLASDADITMARVMVAVGNKASRDTARRVKAARERQAVQGAYGGGRRPFGYEADGITVREAEAAEVRAAADAILAGVSLRMITAGLRERSVPTVTGASWSTGTLRDILLRPRNAGLAVYEGEVTGRAEWPPILDEDTWRTVRARLTDPARRTSPGSAPRWLLSLIARCGVCDDGTTVTASGGRAYQPTYRCSEHNHLRRVARPVDDLVSRLVVARLAQPSAASLLARPGSAPDTAALAREANGARERLNHLATAYAAGDIDAGQLAAGSTELRARLAAADAALAAAAPVSPVAGLAGRADAAEVWAGLDLGRKRGIVAALVDVTLLPATHRGRLPDGTYFDPESVRIEWKHDV